MTNSSAEDDKLVLGLVKMILWGFVVPTLRFAKNGAPFFVLLFGGKQILHSAQDDKQFCSG
jgi:hypothetical protein